MADRRTRARRQGRRGAGTTPRTTRPSPVRSSTPGHAGERDCGTVLLRRARQQPSRRCRPRGPAPRPGVDDLGNPAAGERHHGGAAGKGFGDDQAVRFVPARRDQDGGAVAHPGSQVRARQMSEILDVAAEQGGDAVVEILPVGDRSGKGEPAAASARDLDREMRAFFRHEASEPHQVGPAGTDRPAREVHPVGDDGRGSLERVPPRVRRMSADRDEGRRDLCRRGQGRLEPGGRRSVQRADHRDAQCRCHRHRQVMQAVVVDDVEGVGERTRQVQHQRQVRVVVLEEALRCHGRVVARGRAGGEGPDLQM